MPTMNEDLGPRQAVDLVISCKLRGGHTVKGEYIAYADDLLVAYCEVCDDRIVLPTPPPSETVLRARQLLELTSQLPPDVIVDHLERIRELVLQLENEGTAIDSAIGLLRLTTRSLLVP